MRNIYVRILLGCLWCFGGGANAQINLSAGSTYTQDFTALGTSNLTWTNNTTLQGWYISSASPLTVNTGTNNANACYNFGVAGVNALSDRALGAISTATTHRFGLRILNNAATTISSFNISFTGEQWRSFTAGTLVFEYQTGATVTSLTTGTWTALTALDFASLQTSGGAALDGNAAANRTTKSATLAVSVAQNTEIFFRWTRAGSSSPGLAIDDLSITANAAVATYPVTYFGNGSTGGTVPTDGSSPYASGSTVTVLGPGSMVRAGYTFNNWNTAADGSGTTRIPAATFSMPATNVDLYAQWNLAATPNLIITGTPTNHGNSCPGVAASSVTYTITNTGATAAGVTVVSSNPAEFAVSGLSSTTITGSGGTATYVVTFTPSSAGAKSATITVSSTTSGSNSPTSNLTGTGTTPVAQAVTSAAATLVDNTSATLNGNVTALGVCPLSTQKGFVYSQTATNNNPVAGGPGVTTSPVGGIATGAYTLPLAGLPGGTGYSFKAYVYDGTTYTYGALQTFTTLLPADHLEFVGVPATGNVGVNLASFTVEARRPDNSVDLSYTGNITIAKASGSGNLSGTLTVAAVAGVATFSTAQFDAAGTYTLSNSATGLTGSTSGNIVISLAPSIIYQHNFGTTTISGHPYTVQPPATPTPGILNGNLSTSAWSNNTSTTWTSFAGSAGQALALPSISTTNAWTLTFNVAPGYQTEISSFSFWRQSSQSTNTWVMTINGTAVGSGTVPTLGASTGTINVATPITGLTGTVTVVITFGGTLTGSMRIDDFTLNGFVTSIGTNYYWNGNNTTALSGTWDNADIKWTSPNATATPNVAWPSTGTTNVANFLTGNGTVTLPGTISSVPSNTIIGSGFIFSATTTATLGSPIALNSGGSLGLATSAAGSITLPGIISGPGSLNFNGSGAVTLSGTNTFTGTKTLTTGTLNIANASALGTSGTFIINGGTIDNTSGGGLSMPNLPQTWGGNFSFAGSQALNLGTGAVALTGNRQVNVITSTLTEGGVISGAFGLTKLGAGTLELTGASTYTGTTTVSGGTLLLGAASVVANSSSIIMNGGTLRSAGLSQLMTATLQLIANSTIELGSGSHSLNFANSSAVSWTAATTLTITGWTGTPGASGTGGRINVGTGGLTGAQLAQISFTGFPGTPVLLPTGEVVPPNNSPAITVTPNALSGFTYVQNNGPSASQPYDLSGSNLSPASGSITVTPPANYEISEDNSTFSTIAINIPYTAGVLATTSIYARLRAGLAAGTYNGQLVTNSGGGATAQNVTLNGTVTASSTSDIIEDGDAAFYTPATENIPYTTWQSATITNTGSGANGSIGVFRFRMRDGGTVTNDADNLPTIFNNITFSYTGLANTIRTAAIFDGNFKVADVTTINTNSLVFNVTGNSAFNIGDNSTKALTLRVTFNTTVTDNQKIVYSVGSATAASSATSSQLTTITASSDNNTGNDRNRIEVNADRMVFGQQPTTTSVNTSMAPAVTVRGVDVNNNSDLDYTGAVSITSTGTLTGSPVNAVAASGVATYSTLTHTATGTGFTLTATTTGLAFSNTITSNTFDITAIIYANNDWRSLTPGTWTSVSGAGTATWERYSTATSTWSAVPGSSPTGTTTVYIDHNITIPVTAGSYGGASINIMPGDTLTYETSSPWTANKMYIYSKGLLQINSRLTIASGATFEVEDSATVNFNYDAYSGTNLGTSLWNGEENFHPLSNFVIQNQNSTSDYFIPSEGVMKANTYNGFTACFGNLVFNSSVATANYDFFGGTFTKNLTHNDFIIRSAVATANVIRFTAFNLTTTIGRNFIMESGANRTFNLTNTSGVTINFTINGDLINNSNKNFNINNCTSVGSTSVVNLKGDMVVGASAGIITATFSGNTTSFNFTGTGDGLTANTTQTVDYAATVATRNQYINFNANAGSYVQFINQNFPLGLSARFTVKTGAVLDFGFNGLNALNLAGNGITGTGFTAEAGSYLKITSPQGVMAISGAVGNIQTNTAPVYTQPITYHYIGKEAQSTGTGIENTSNGRAVIVELASNALTLTPSVAFGLTSTTNANVNGAKGGVLDIRKGQFIETETAYITGTSGTLYMSPGTLYKIMKGSADAATAYADPIPRMNGGTFPYILTGGTIELGGNIANNYFQVLRADNANYDYHNIQYSGTNTLGTDYKALTSITTVTDSLYITGNAIVDCRGNAGTAQSFVGSGGLIMDGGRIRFKNVSNPQPELSGTTVPYKLMSGVTEFYGASNSSRQSVKGTNITGPGAYDIIYKEIEITGDISSTDSSNVGQSGQTIHLNATGGKLTVKTALPGVYKAGRFTMSDVAVRSANPTNTSNVTVEDGGTFVTNSSKGFSGFTSTFTDNSSVHAEINSVVLANGSTVIYNRTGLQDISNQVPYHHLVIAGTLAKTAPANTLTVQGNFTKTGNSTFAHNNGTVLFNGPGTQTYSSTSGLVDFYNFTDNNTTAVNINDTLRINHEILFGTNAKLHLNTGDVIIRSTATSTARVAPVPSGVGLTYTSGRFSIERYLPLERAWRFVATPVIKGIGESPTIRQSWQENNTVPAGYGTYITGPEGTANGFDTISPAYSMKWYNSVANNYTNVRRTDTVVANDAGYMLYVRGDRTVSPTGTTKATNLRIKGKIRTGDQAFTIPPNGFQSIGNPYASAFRIDTLIGRYSGAVLGRAYFAWDPTLNGSYGVGGFQTLSEVDGFKAQAAGNAGTSSMYIIDQLYPLIESGQAFYLENKSVVSPLTVTITESMKEAGSRLASREVNTPADRQFMRTRLYTNTDVIADGNMVAFDDEFENGPDGYDAVKFTNGGENFGLARFGKKLSVEARGRLQERDTIFYSMSNLREQPYKIELAPENLASTGMEAYFIDRFLNTQTPVSLAGNTTLNISITAAPASKAADRFLLVFKPMAGPVPVTFVSVTAQRQADRSIAVNWKVANEVNIVRYEVERSANGNTGFTAILTRDAEGISSYGKNDLSPLATDNFYRIKAIGIGGEITYSDIVKVSPLTSTPSISVYPNPVTDGIMTVRFSGQQKGTYMLELNDAKGSLVYKGSVRVTADQFSESIQLATKMPTGTYLLSVTAPDGTRNSSQVFLQ